jgi:hypothetical protein
MHHAEGRRAVELSTLKSTLSQKVLALTPRIASVLLGLLQLLAPSVTVLRPHGNIGGRLKGQGVRRWLQAMRQILNTSRQLRRPASLRHLAQSCGYIPCTVHQKGRKRLGRCSSGEDRCRRGSFRRLAFPFALAWPPCFLLGAGLRRVGGLSVHSVPTASTCQCTRMQGTETRTHSHFILGVTMAGAPNTCLDPRLRDPSEDRNRIVSAFSGTVFNAESSEGLPSMTRKVSSSSLTAKLPRIESTAAARMPPARSSKKTAGSGVSS